MRLNDAESGRRKVLKKSGQLIAGGLTLGSITASASASTSHDLNLESDFQNVGSRYERQEINGENIYHSTNIYRPSWGSDLSRSGYRVVRSELELDASFYEHDWGYIEMKGKNGARLEEVWPGNTIPQTSTSRTKSVSVSAGPSGGDVSIGFSTTEGMTKSGLHIDDKSRKAEELCKHRYELSGGLETNHIALEAIAVFDTTSVEEYDEVVDGKWYFHQADYDPNDFDGEYTFTYRTGNLE